MDINNRKLQRLDKSGRAGKMISVDGFWTKSTVMTKTMEVAVESVQWRNRMQEEVAEQDANIDLWM